MNTLHAIIEKNNTDSAGVGEINDRSIDGMFVFWNPCARANLHQQKRAPKLCSATLKRQTGKNVAFLRLQLFVQ